MLIVKIEQVVYGRSSNLCLINLDVGCRYSLIIIITVVASATSFYVCVKSCWRCSSRPFLVDEAPQVDRRQEEGLAGSCIVLCNRY